MNSRPLEPHSFLMSKIRRKIATFLKRVGDLLAIDMFYLVMKQLLKIHQEVDLRGSLTVSKAHLSGMLSRQRCVGEIYLDSYSQLRECGATSFSTSAILLRF